jgi:hypothetical protein
MSGSPAPNMESKPTGPKYDFSQFANGFTVADIDQVLLWLPRITMTIYLVENGCCHTTK